MAVNEIYFWIILKSEQKMVVNEIILNDFKSEQKRSMNEIYFWTILKSEQKKSLNENYFWTIFIK